MLQRTLTAVPVYNEVDHVAGAIAGALCYCDEVLVVDEAARAYASATFDCDTCDRRVGLHFGKPYRVAREHAPTLGCLCCGRDEAVS